MSNYIKTLPSSNNELQGMLQRLQHQLQQVARHRAEHRHGSRGLLDGDLQTIRDLAAVQNAQHPDLHLVIADSVDELLTHIRGMPPDFHLRCVFRAPQTDNAQHHLYADIQRPEGSPPSLLIIEPANIKNNRNAIEILMALLVQMMPDPAFSQRRMAVINAGVQETGLDCLIFCFDFALKAHRHAALFNTLHAVHHGGRAVGNVTGDAQTDRNNQDTFSIAPADLLPASFFEHAQARDRACLPASIEQVRHRFLLHAILALSELPDATGSLMSLF
jgi:hypothetical protein